MQVKTGKEVSSAKSTTVKKGKTAKLLVTQNIASETLKAKKHVKVRFESSNAKIAKVNAKGVIKGVAKGSCTVYAYTQNGVYAQVKVTVK